jgi:hypothetical protein
MNKSRTLIPKNWTPEQALTVFDLLIALQQAIWDLYQSAILRLLMEQDAPLGSIYSVINQTFPSPPDPWSARHPLGSGAIPSPTAPVHQLP